MLGKFYNLKKKKYPTKILYSNHIICISIFCLVLRKFKKKKLERKNFERKNNIFAFRCLV